MHISIDIWECNPGEFHSEPLQTVSKWALHGPAMGQEDAALQNRTGAFCCPPPHYTPVTGSLAWGSSHAHNLILTHHHSDSRSSHKAH